MSIQKRSFHAGIEIEYYFDEKGMTVLCNNQMNFQLQHCH